MHITEITTTAEFPEISRIFKTSSLEHKGYSVKNGVANIHLCHEEDEDPDELFNKELADLRANKGERFRKIVLDLATEIPEQIEKFLDKAIQSDGIDMEEWEEESAKYYLPKTLLCALLERVAQRTELSKNRAQRMKINKIKYYI